MSNELLSLCILWYSVFSAATNNDFHINPINESGIFYEDLGLVYSIQDTHTLLIITNMTQLDKKLTFAYMTYLSGTTLCTDTPNQFTLNCRSTFSLISQEINKLSKKFKSIQDMTGHQRQKRGIMNGLSTALKWLIGTPDANYAETFNNAIQSFKAINNANQNLVNKEVTVVNASILAQTRMLHTLNNLAWEFTKNIQEFKGHT